MIVQFVWVPLWRLFHTEWPWKMDPIPEGWYRFNKSSKVNYMGGTKFSKWPPQYKKQPELAIPYLYSKGWYGCL